LILSWTEGVPSNRYGSPRPARSLPVHSPQCDRAGPCVPWQQGEGRRAQPAARLAAAAAEVAARSPRCGGAPPRCLRQPEHTASSNARVYTRFRVRPCGIHIRRRLDKTTPIALLQPAIQPRSTGPCRPLARRRDDHLQGI